MKPLMKPLNGFLMTQKQMTLKGKCGYTLYNYNVRKLHRPRISDASLADIVDTVLCIARSV